MRSQQPQQAGLSLPAPVSGGQTSAQMAPVGAPQRHLLGQGAPANAWQCCGEVLQDTEGQSASEVSARGSGAVWEVSAVAWASRVGVSLLPAWPDDAAPAQMRGGLGGCWPNSGKRPPEAEEEPEQEAATFGGRLAAQERHLRHLLRQLPQQASVSAQPPGAAFVQACAQQPAAADKPAWRQAVWDDTSPNTQHPLRFAVCFLELLAETLTEAQGAEGDAAPSSETARLGDDSSPLSTHAHLPSPTGPAQQRRDQEALLNLFVAAGQGVAHGQQQQTLLAAGVDHFCDLRQRVCGLPWARAQLARSLVAVSNRTIIAAGGLALHNIALQSWRSCDH